jgi:molecular chaperone GrpE (heat shock protein)
MKEARAAPEVIASAASTSSTNPLHDIEMDIAALMKRCGSLASELEDYKNQSQASNKKMLLGFIEVADAFENVFRSIGPRLDAADQQTRIWVNNFRTIHKMLLRALTSCGITPIETIIGTKANPHWHNVTEIIQQPDREGETIVEEIKKGYLWHGALLRAADVKAVKND